MDLLLYLPVYCTLSFHFFSLSRSPYIHLCFFFSGLFISVCISLSHCVLASFTYWSSCTSCESTFLLSELASFQTFCWGALDNALSKKQWEHIGSKIDTEWTSESSWRLHEGKVELQFFANLLMGLWYCTTTMCEDITC